jgi:hypothetical protein
MSTTITPEIISYHRLRQLIGIMGFALPIILLVGSAILSLGVLGSISDYYDTALRDYLEGVLFVTGVFLVCYFGYDWRDTMLSVIAGVAALGIAIFPCTRSEYVHYIFAGIFFGALGLFCLWLFPKTKKNHTPSKRKCTRNTIYRWCGGIIFGAMLLCFLYKYVFSTTFPWLVPYSPVFWLESLANAAFGTSWLIKGGVLYRD